MSRSTALKASMLTITPSIKLSYKEQFYYVTIQSHSFLEIIFEIQPIRKHIWSSSHVEIPNEMKIVESNMSAKFGSICSHDN